jgi:DNA repair exonuclease SbcCD ATPase subunit
MSTTLLLQQAMEHLQIDNVGHAQHYNNSLDSASSASAQQDDDMQQNSSSNGNPTEQFSSTDVVSTRVVAEYEKTMIGCIQSAEELKAKLNDVELEKIDLIRERDQSLEDLRNVENAFSDVHRKYERAKGLLENYRLNEEILKKRDEEMLARINKRDRKIEELKEKVQKSLQQMNADYQVKAKEMESENNRLRVLLRKAEMKVDTLESDVEQKGRELHKLNALCDELVSGKIN